MKDTWKSVSGDKVWYASRIEDTPLIFLNLLPQDIEVMKIKEEWNPGYYDKHKVFHAYEKRWYCTENKLIHGSEKEKNNCKHCKEL